MQDVGVWSCCWPRWSRVGALFLLISAGCGRFGFSRLPSSDSGADAASDSGTDHPPVVIVDHCLNQISDGGETGVDCGGECPACAVAQSCQTLLMMVPDATSGVYQLDVDGSGPQPPFFSFCEMQADGGGWTLALKMDGAQQTFSYANALWTNTETLNDNMPSFDKSEAKLAAFNLLAFHQIRVVMVTGNDTRSIVLGDSNGIGGVFSGEMTSLRDLFGMGANRYTMVGRDTWLTLVPGSAMAPNCNREGINVAADFNIAQVNLRIGILANNENQCLSPDSFVGIGFSRSYLACNTTLNTFAGNAAGCNDPNDRNIAAWSYLFVR